MPFAEKPVRCAVLTYHSNNVLGPGYAANDHVALAEDLRLLAALRLPVRPLHEAVRLLEGGAGEPFVALTFDDGSWFDWHDLEHPTLGPQRSFANVLQDAESTGGAALPATSFVIVSPQARAELDRTCLVGQGWWGDEWWQAAVASGRLAIESHSWDHQHDTLAQTATGLPGGTFKNIATHAAADIEIRQASDFLDSRLPTRRTRHFAYPYGDASDYLVRDYLPRFRHEHRLEAAFGTVPEPVAAGADRWHLGRYVCGPHWDSPDALRALLRDALGVAA
jgi:peptidoglycan/xylan/chitin deacetylase (PgdA/CDA1 family)